jgi:HK97 family phage major capsid protein
MVYEDGAGIFGENAWKAINTSDYRNAFRDYLRLPKHKISLKSMKTLEEGLDDQGGYLVPVDLINRIVQRKPTPTRVAGLVASVNTSREWVEMMKLNYATDNIYTTGFRVTKTGEQASSATAARVTDTNLFGTIKIPVHTFMITGLVTLNMIEDAAFNPLAFFEDKFNETTDILRDDKILNGIGRQEPRGILSTDRRHSQRRPGLDDPLISVVPSGDATLITADSLIALNCDVPSSTTRTAVRVQQDEHVQGHQASSRT